MKKWLIALLVLLALAAGGYYVLTRQNINPKHQVGEVLDQFNGVAVYYNGGVNHVLERNTAPDGYNIGLKYQCVEFIKRYYYQHLNHKMPDSYGHAKSFYQQGLASGALNPQRNLYQYTNGSDTLPQVGDIVVYEGTTLNPYGHVAIVAALEPDDGWLEIIQQNAGPFAKTRVRYPLAYHDQGYWIEQPHILGWLGKRIFTLESLPGTGITQ